MLFELVQSSQDTWHQEDKSSWGVVFICPIFMKKEVAKTKGWALYLTKDEHFKAMFIFLLKH